MSTAKHLKASSHIFGGANLTAAEKKLTDVRPLAAGETLGRVIAKTRCYTEYSHAGSYFFPLQMGVAQRAGTERISHLVRSKFNKIRLGDDSLILKVDFRNAFNGVSRDAMLALTRKYFPRLFRWVEWCYANTSILTFDAWEILSCEGVQQGDPLGPLLFPLVLQEVVKKIHDSIPTLKLNKSYLATV